MCVCIYYIYICVCMYIYMCVCVYIYICVCVCVCVCTHTESLQHFKFACVIVDVLCSCYDWQVVTEMNTVSLVRPHNLVIVLHI
jgi:hypothetical protein